MTWRSPRHYLLYSCSGEGQNANLDGFSTQNIIQVIFVLCPSMKRHLLIFKLIEINYAEFKKVMLHVKLTV